MLNTVTVDSLIAFYIRTLKKSWEKWGLELTEAAISVYNSYIKGNVKGDIESYARRALYCKILESKMKECNYQKPLVSMEVLDVSNLADDDVTMTTLELLKDLEKLIGKEVLRIGWYKYVDNLSINSIRDRTGLGRYKIEAALKEFTEGVRRYQNV